ncbi:MAG TPA: MBG domain-containing protein, partial [Verrucomicrobiae bacterium]|nr:MBG domain-containing protein [Verrucomicrobiae bacterium]
VEERVKGRGSFATMCVFPKPEPGDNGGTGPHEAGYVYQATVNGKHYRAFVFGSWKDQRTVSEATIEGVALGDAIVLGDGATPTEQGDSGQTVSSYTPTTSGPNTLLYMIARFNDQGSDPISESSALSEMQVVSNFWINCSGGNVYLKGLVHATQAMDIVHIVLPHPASYASTYNTNFVQLLADARSAASAQGFNYANYNLDVVITTSSGFGYAGLSYVGGQGSHWVQGYTSLRTAGHELGHNLGLWHANYWRTDSTQPFGKDSNPGGYVSDTTNGEWVEYGHYFSVMSGQWGGEWDDATKPIYNPVEKVQLGWLTGSQVQYVSASGTYRLFRHDAESTVGTPRGIRIETPATDYTGTGHRYWLQYRYALWNTAFNWYQNGLEMDVAKTTYGSDGSVQLDMTPYSNDQPSPFYNAASPPVNWWTLDNNDKLDGALLLGRSFDDAAAGIHVTPVAKGNNGAGEEYLDVVINLGSFSSDHAPVIASLVASTNRVAAGQSVNFTVSATDPDGDALAYSWDFGDAPTWTASGLNSTSASKSWSSAGQYLVTATVSDMKGRYATASTAITVGQPSNTGQIWGRVVRSGQPVYGARLSTWGGSLAQAWTASDGSYVLTDLPTNLTYAVTCSAAGLTFTSEFSSPVSIASGAAYGIDFYANEALGNGSVQIAVAPYEVQLAGGQSTAFRAGAWDASGNPTTVSATWAVSGGGYIDSAGRFTATTAGGPYTVTATSGLLSSTGSVWVTSSAQVPAPVMWTSPGSIPYGAALGASQLNASSLVGGSFTYNPALGAVLNAGNNQTLSATFHPTDTTSYSSVTTNVSISVSKALLTVTAKNTNKVYGASLPAFSALYSGFTNGDSVASLTTAPALSTTATASSPVGTYPIQVSGGVSSNYTFQLVNGTLTITPATPVVTWTNPAPIAFGTLVSSNQLNAAANVPGNFGYNPTNGAMLNPGTNNLTVVFTPTDGADYLTVTDVVSLAVLMVYDGVNLSDPVEAASDPDGDGFSNLAEYALGSNPTNSSDALSGFVLSVVTNSGSQYVTLQYKQRHDTSAFPLQYIPEVSADGQTWYSDTSHVLQVSVTILNSEFDWVTVQDKTPTTGSAPRFIRLRITEN